MIERGGRRRFRDVDRVRINIRSEQTSRGPSAHETKVSSESLLVLNELIERAKHNGRIAQLVRASC